MRTANISGKIEITDGKEMIMPGDNAKLKITLRSPLLFEEN